MSKISHEPLGSASGADTPVAAPRRLFAPPKELSVFSAALYCASGANGEGEWFLRRVLGLHGSLSLKRILQENQMDSHPMHWQRLALWEVGRRLEERPIGSLTHLLEDNESTKRYLRASVATEAKRMAFKQAQVERPRRMADADLSEIAPKHEVELASFQADENAIPNAIARLEAVLPPRQFEVVSLRAEDLSTGEIAKRLGMKESTVRVNLMNARRNPDVLRLLRDLTQGR